MIVEISKSYNAFSCCLNWRKHEETDVLKTSVVVFAVLTAVMVVCAATMISVSSVELNFNALVTEKLASKPEEYFVLTDADPALLQAISHPGETVPLHLLDETEIDDLMEQHGTNNIEYQNNYYSIGILFVEPSGIYRDVFWMSLVGFVVSAAFLVSLAIFEGLRYVRKRREQQLQIVN